MSSPEELQVRIGVTLGDTLEQIRTTNDRFVELQRTAAQNIKAEVEVNVSKESEDSGKSAGEAFSNSFSNAALKAFDLVSGGLQAITSKVIGQTEEAFAKGIKFEKFEAVFTSLIGDADRAKAALNAVANAAPAAFDIPTLDKAAQKLLNFNVSAEQLAPTLTQLSAIAVGTGQSIDKLSGIYGRAAASGTLTIQSIRQLSKAGVPILQTLSQQLNVSEKDVEALAKQGALQFGDLQRAISTLTSEGGRFGDVLANQANTIGGKIQSITNTYTQAQLQLFDSLKPAAGALLDLFGNSLKAAADTGVFDGLKTQAEAFGAEIANNEELSNALSEALRSGVNTLGTVAIDAAKAFTQALRDNPQLISDTISAISEMIKLLGEALKIAIDFAATLVDAAGGVKAATTTGGAEGAAAKARAGEAGISGQDFDKQLFAQLDQKKINRFNPFDTGKAGQEAEALANRLVDEQAAKNKAEAKLPKPVKPIAPFEGLASIAPDANRDLTVRPKAKKVDPSQEALKGFGALNAERTASLAKAESAQTAIVAQQLAARSITQKDAALQLAQIQASGTKQQSAEFQRQTNEINRLESSKLITATQAQERRAKISEQSSALVVKSAQNELAVQKAKEEVLIQAIDRRAAAAKVASDASVRSAEREKANLDNLNSTLDQSLKLTQSRNSLANAQAQSAQGGTQIGLETLARADEARKRLQTGQDSKPVQDVLAQQAAAGGLTANITDEQALKAKLALENQLATQKSAALQSEQNQARVLLEIDTKRNQISAQLAVNEARIGEAKAAAAQLEAQFALQKAQIQGDEQAVTLAQSQVELARQVKDLSQERTLQTREALTAQTELANNAKAELATRQQLATAQANAAESARQQADALALAETKAKAVATAQQQGGGNTARAAEPGGSGGASDANAQTFSAGPINFGSKADTDLRSAQRAFSSATAGADPRSALLGQAGLQKDNPFFTQLLQQGGFADIAGQVAKGGVGAGNRDITDKLDVLIDATLSSPRTLNVTTPDPGKDAGDIMYKMSQNSARSRGGGF